MKIKFYKYEDTKNEIISDGTTCMTIKDKTTGRYYEVPVNDSNCNNFEKISWDIKETYHSFVLLCIYWVVFIALTMMNIHMIVAASIIDKVLSGKFIAALLIYLFIFIIFHELGHLYMLYISGRKANKIGFKFNYIFPSFYVQINEIYMLDKIQKLYIHSGGLMASLIMNVGTYVMGCIFNINVLMAVSTYMSVTIVYNMIPLMNSDGYKILITFLNRAEKKDAKNNCKLISIIRVINILFTIAYTIAFFSNIIND
jgi:hypothetical protein